MNSVVPPAPHGVLPKACSRLCLPAISGVLGREGNQHMEVSCVGGAGPYPLHSVPCDRTLRTIPDRPAHHP